MPMTLGSVIRTNDNIVGRVIDIRPGFEVRIYCLQHPNPSLTNRTISRMPSEVEEVID